MEYWDRNKHSQRLRLINQTEPIIGIKTILETCNQDVELSEKVTIELEILLKVY
jgi:hypothetical protein